VDSQIYKSCVQLPTYADNKALPAFARPTTLLQQSIDICYPPDRPHTDDDAVGHLQRLAKKIIVGSANDSEMSCLPY